MPLKTAAAKHKVPYETTRNWKRKDARAGDDWEIARAAMRLSSSGAQSLTAEVIEDFVYLFNMTLKELKDSKDIPPLEKAKLLAGLSDAYAKTIKAASSSNPAISRLAIAMDVLKRMTDHIRKNHPELLAQFTEMLEKFGQELNRAYR